jgi:hypothetical protein
MNNHEQINYDMPLEHPGFENKMKIRNIHIPQRAIHFQTASPKIEMS